MAELLEKLRRRKYAFAFISCLILSIAINLAGAILDPSSQSHNDYDNDKFSDGINYQLSSSDSEPSINSDPSSYRRYTQDILHKDDRYPIGRRLSRSILSDVYQCFIKIMDMFKTERFRIPASCCSVLKYFNTDTTNAIAMAYCSGKRNNLFLTEVKSIQDNQLMPRYYDEYNDHIDNNPIAKRETQNVFLGFVRKLLRCLVYAVTLQKKEFSTNDCCRTIPFPWYCLI